MSKQHSDRFKLQSWSTVPGGKRGGEGIVIGNCFAPLASHHHHRHNNKQSSFPRFNLLPGTESCWQFSGRRRMMGAHCDSSSLPIPVSKLKFEIYLDKCKVGEFGYVDCAQNAWTLMVDLIVASSSEISVTAEFLGSGGGSGRKAEDDDEDGKDENSKNWLQMFHIKRSRFCNLSKNCHTLSVLAKTKKDCRRSRRRRRGRSTTTTTIPTPVVTCNLVSMMGYLAIGKNDDNIPPSPNHVLIIPEDTHLDTSSLSTLLVLPPTFTSILPSPPVEAIVNRTVVSQVHFSGTTDNDTILGCQFQIGSKKSDPVSGIRLSKGPWNAASNLVVGETGTCVADIQFTASDGRVQVVNTSFPVTVSSSPNNVQPYTLLLRNEKPSSATTIETANEQVISSSPMFRSLPPQDPLLAATIPAPVSGGRSVEFTPLLAVTFPQPFTNGKVLNIRSGGLVRGGNTNFILTRDIFFGITLTQAVGPSVFFQVDFRSRTIGRVRTANARRVQHYGLSVDLTFRVGEVVLSGYTEQTRANGGRQRLNADSEKNGDNWTSIAISWAREATRDSTGTHPLPEFEVTTLGVCEAINVG